MGSSYKLCGFINPFDVEYGIIYPVYTFRNKFYIEDGGENTLDDIVELKDNYYEKIVKLEKYSIKKSSEDDFSLNKDGILRYAFLVNGNVIYGKLDYVCRKLKKIKTEDKYVMDEINDFIKENKKFIVSNPRTIRVTLGTSVPRTGWYTQPPRTVAYCRWHPVAKADIKDGSTSKTKVGHKRNIIKVSDTKDELEHLKRSSEKDTKHRTGKVNRAAHKISKGSNVLRDRRKK